MSVNEESFTQARFRQAFARRHQLHRGKRIGNLTIMGSDADGTHFFWEDEVGDRHFGVISDLLSFNILRTGSVTVTIAANAAGGNADVTLSPALTGDITDYLILVSTRGAGGFTTGFMCAGQLTTLSNLRVSAVRQNNNATTATPSTSLDPTYPSDTQIDVGLGHTHATDASAATDHQHTVAHSHTVGFLGAGGSATIFWAIIRV